MEMHFKYQYFWHRVLILLPIVIFLPTLEKLLLQKATIEINQTVFYPVSVLLMYAFVFLAFPRLRFFATSGVCVLQDNRLQIRLRVKVFDILYQDIQCVWCKEMRIYGMKCGVFVIEFKDERKPLRLFTEDLHNKELTDSGLWSICSRIEPLL